MLIEFIQPNFTFQDERGKLTQLIRAGFKQVNVIESKAGALRGGHYHKVNREAFYIIYGTVVFTASQNGQEETHTFSDGDMFLVPAEVSHSFDFQTDTLLVSLYDQGVELEDGSKDIHVTPKV
ncbi:cupin domain-containing protein [Oscillibacter sp.]|uniref:polysaccharide biosynthesis C-terminal domain-containing protein n=1 Tax=Oscillibacter sp. TaxID=1945593 RepID=UPI0028ABD747|nr:cupin domain-containing protein [Oscillibacter sp.]